MGWRVRVTKDSQSSGRKRTKLLKILLILLVNALVVSIAITIALNWNLESLGEKIDVAIYAGAGTWDDSVHALEKMFNWMNYTVRPVTADYINNNGLAAFRILCIRGGSMYDYAQDISSKGKENIKNFVNNGGGYVGICGGAYFASERVVWRGSQMAITPLGLFQGSTIGPVNEIMPYPNYTMCKVNIVNHAHPITNSEGEFEWILYYWGPALIPNVNTNATILGNYNEGNRTAMLAFEQGDGKVFLIGTHPEIEEDSGRDGVSFGDEFNDQGSEWELMQKAVLWCLGK